MYLYTFNNGSLFMSNPAALSLNSVKSAMRITFISNASFLSQDGVSGG